MCLDFCNSLFNELNKTLKLKDTSNVSGKGIKRQNLIGTKNCIGYGKNMTFSEKIFLKYKGGTRNTKQNFLNEYRNAENIFDKRLHGTERAYNNEKVDQTENCSTSNPKQFWNHLKKNLAHV